MANPITYTIPGLPLLNQLAEASNPNDDCVFTSNAAIATAYTGTRYTGTQLKAMDSDYGPTYVGFASEAKLVDTMARLGVKMVQVSHPTQQLLLDELHWQIGHYHQACIVTMPSQWNSAPLAKGWNPRAYNGYSHVGVMCGVGNGWLRCMNPWGAFFQDQPDSWWAQRLLTGSIWVASKMPTPVIAPVRPVTPAPATAPVAVAASAPLTDAEKLAMIAHILAS